jgi:hypothetical protein
MDTSYFTIVETGQPLDHGLRMWTHERSARLFASETYEVWNAGRMITRPVMLCRDNMAIDCFEGHWMSGYVLEDD